MTTDCFPSFSFLTHDTCQVFSPNPVQLLEVIGAEPRPAPWSVRALKVAELSVAEAEQMGYPTVEPEHLLLGILADGGPGAGLLTRSGITAEAIRGIVPRNHE